MMMQAVLFIQDLGHSYTARMLCFPLRCSAGWIFHSILRMGVKVKCLLFLNIKKSCKYYHKYPYKTKVRDMFCCISFCGLYYEFVAKCQMHCVYVFQRRIFQKGILWKYIFRRWIVEMQMTYHCKFSGHQWLHKPQ